MTSNVISINPTHVALAAQLRSSPKSKTVLALDLASMNLTYPTMLEVGKVLGLTRSIISDARSVLSHGTPVLIAQLRCGEITMSGAIKKIHPTRATSAKKYNVIRRERRQVVVTLQPSLIGTQRLSAEIHIATVHACDVLIALPRAEDVVINLSAAEKEKLHRAYQRLWEMINVNL